MSVSGPDLLLFFRISDNKIKMVKTKNKKESLRIDSEIQVVGKIEFTCGEERGERRGERGEREERKRKQMRERDEIGQRGEIRF